MQTRTSIPMPQPHFIFHQLFESESSTYTYLIADSKTKECALIDPVVEMMDRDLKLVTELKLNLKFVLDTHVHADHITAAGLIREKTGCKIAVFEAAEVGLVDIALKDGQQLFLGDLPVEVISTPGHTKSCVSFKFQNFVFTGDTLLIRGCGRTDFQEGSSEQLYYSVHEKLFKLPDDTILYPGHDYRGHTSSTIGQEKRFNPRLNESISKDDFKKIMSDLKLANPKKIHEAVPANLASGLTSEKVLGTRSFFTSENMGIPEVTAEQVRERLGHLRSNHVRLIDVRRPDEFTGELGHIRGAELKTLGPNLLQFLESADKSEEVIFICRSGARSANATAESLARGFKFVANLNGGMMRWNQLGYPTEQQDAK